jgi:hypothetical protein
MTLAKKNPMAIFQELSDLLQKAHDWEDDFYNFAIDNEEEVKIALYAKSVIEGYAANTEKLISASEEAIVIFREFLESRDTEEGK